MFLVDSEDFPHDERWVEDVTIQHQGVPSVLRGLQFLRIRFHTLIPYVTDYKNVWGIT
jgi:hypothetical protein